MFWFIFVGGLGLLLGGWVFIKVIVVNIVEKELGKLIGEIDK